MHKDGSKIYHAWLLQKKSPFGSAVNDPNMYQSCFIFAKTPGKIPLNITGYTVHFGLPSLLMWIFHSCSYMCRLQGTGHRTNRVQLCLIVYTVFCITVYIFHSHSSTLSYLAPSFFSNIYPVMSPCIAHPLLVLHFPTLTDTTTSDKGPNRATTSQHILSHHFDSNLFSFKVIKSCPATREHERGLVSVIKS